MVIPPELDLPGPSGSSEEVLPSASQRKLGNLGEKGNLAGKELQGN